MRRYTARDEERIRVQAQVRDWTRAGLLTPAQGTALATELRTELRRTGALLRAVLALFTAIIVVASVALLYVSLELRTQIATAVVLAIAGAACIALAEYLVGAFRLYSHGVEEALAVASLVLAGAGAAEAVRAAGTQVHHASSIAWLLVSSIGGFAVYRRYGRVYVGVGSMIAAAMLAFQLNVTEAMQRAIAAAVFGAAFAIARAARLRHEDDFLSDEDDILQAAACAGVYLVLNLHVTDVIRFAPGTPPAATWFYWSTYAATWLIPAAGLAIAIREKDRSLLAVGLALGLCTLATNKPYLGWPRQTWDPMILGALLVAGAVALRRWLASGPAGQRGGFTAAQILERDRDVLSALATASVALHGHGHEPPPGEAPSSDFGGGRSGGAGGGAEY